jgi:hypothetical protein
MAKTITIETRLLRRWAEGIMECEEEIDGTFSRATIDRATTKLALIAAAIREESKVAEKLAERTLDTHAEYATREEANS